MLDKSPIRHISESKTAYAYLLKINTGETFTIYPSPGKDRYAEWFENMTERLTRFLEVDGSETTLDLRNLRALNKVKRLENLFNPPIAVLKYQYLK